MAHRVSLYRGRWTDRHRLVVGASVRTGLHPKSCPDPQDNDEDGQGDEAGMQPTVAPIGNGKHDKYEDESANELECEVRYGIRSRRRWALTSSKKQLADDM
jgi:hypothetical protein